VKSDTGARRNNDSIKTVKILCHSVQLQSRVLFHRSFKGHWATRQCRNQQSFKERIGVWIEMVDKQEGRVPGARGGARSRSKCAAQKYYPFAQISRSDVMGICADQLWSRCPQIRIRRRFIRAIIGGSLLLASARATVSNWWTLGLEGIIQELPRVWKTDSFTLSQVYWLKAFLDILSFYVSINISGDIVFSAHTLALETIFGLSRLIQIVYAR